MTLTKRKPEEVSGIPVIPKKLSVAVNCHFATSLRVCAGALAFTHRESMLAMILSTSQSWKAHMQNFVIWLDSEKAQIFALETSGIKKSHVEKSGINHHTHNAKDNPGDSQQEHFFKDLASKLVHADQLLIVGPGLAKTHFKTFLETHHVNGLAKKVIGVENTDHPTDNQILAIAREFYKTYDLFNQPITQ